MDEMRAAHEEVVAAIRALGALGEANKAAIERLMAANAAWVDAMTMRVNRELRRREEAGPGEQWEVN